MNLPSSSPPAPPPPGRRSQFVAIVRQNLNVCREHHRLSLYVENFPPTEPGQFVQVACRDLNANYSPETELDWELGQAPSLKGRELMSPLAMLRRAFSLAGRTDIPDGSELDLIQRVVGVGTSWLSRLMPGDKVYLLGPLGNHFLLPTKDEFAILIAGGVGIGPMLYLASRLRGRAIAFIGAVARDLLPLTIGENVGDRESKVVGRGSGKEMSQGHGDAGTRRGTEDVEPGNVVTEFAKCGVPAVISTDDGSYGFRGFVTQALECYLKRHFPPGIPPQGRLTPVFYTCGPEPMMKRVAELAAAGGWEAQIAVERAMGCGMGTCQSCVIRVKRPASEPAADGRNWNYKLACTDGPVFSARELVW